MRFSEMTSPQIAEAAKRNALVLVPIGQVEEHGPHLPTATDAMIADEVAGRIASAIEGQIPVVVMDTVRYGYSVKEVARWAGTIRLSTDTVINMMCEICGSLAGMGFKKVAILNAHGNHPGLLEVVSRRVADEHDLDVPVLDLGKLAADTIARHGEGGEGAVCHACEFETSMMLHLRPELVRKDLYPAGDRVVVKNPGGSAVFWSTWQRQRSKSGIYGDPSTASAEKGEKFLQGIVEKACEFLLVYYRHTRL